MFLLELSSYLSVLLNSASVSYASTRLKEKFPIDRLPMFLIVLISHFVIKFIMSGIFGDIPYRLVTLFQR